MTLTVLDTFLVFFSTIDFIEWAKIELISFFKLCLSGLIDMSLPTTSYFLPLALYLVTVTVMSDLVGDMEFRVIGEVCTSFFSIDFDGESLESLYAADFDWDSGRDYDGLDKEIVPFEGDFSTSFIDGDDPTLRLLEWFAPLGGERSLTDGEESYLLCSLNLGYIGCLGGDVLVYAERGVSASLALDLFVSNEAC